MKLFTDIEGIYIIVGLNHHLPMTYHYTCLDISKLMNQCSTLPSTTIGRIASHLQKSF